MICSLVPRPLFSIFICGDGKGLVDLHRTFCSTNSQILFHKRLIQFSWRSDGTRIDNIKRVITDLQLNWTDLFAKELLCSYVLCSFLQSFSLAV